MPDGSLGLFSRDFVLKHLRYRNIELISIIDSTRLDLRQVNVIMVQVKMLKARYVDLHHLLCYRLCFLCFFFLIRILILLFLRYWDTDRVCASRVRICEATKLVGQDKVQVTVLQEGLSLPRLQV